MSNKDISTNPFAALFPSITQAVNFTSTQTVDNVFQLQEDKVVPDDPLATDELLKSFESKLNSASLSIEELAKEKLEVNQIIEKVFLITLDKDALNGEGCVSRYVYLEELVQMLSGQDWLDLDCLDQAVFERLLLPEPECHLISNVPRLHVDPVLQKFTVEKKVIYYLSQCYQRCLTVNIKCSYSAVLDRCKHVILTNSRLALQNVEIYPDQEICQQLVDILVDSYGTNYFDKMFEFFQDVAVEIDNNFKMSPDEMTASDTLQPLLYVLYDRIKPLSLVNLSLNTYLEILMLFCKNHILAEVFLDFNQPAQKENGRSYENTLLGSILSLTCLPKSSQGPYEFFDHPSHQTQQEHKITESNLWRPIGELNGIVYLMIFSILKLGPHFKHRMLKWIGNCLESNAGRSKLGSSLMPDIFNPVFASDGFSLNLSAVLLRLCKPVCSDHALVKVSPYYCATEPQSDDDQRKQGIYLKCLHQETCLIPHNEQDRPKEDNFSFSTEIFYMTHFSLYQGFHTIYGKFIKQNQELGRQQRAYEDALIQGGENVDGVQTIKEVMEDGMSKYLLMKAALLEPHNLEMMLELHVGTATYLNHLSLTDDMTTFIPVSFPLPVNIPRSLMCIPEFIIESIVDFMTFLRRFNDDMYETAGKSLKHLMTLILVFMGSRERMKNPHLRAKLAEALEALMPHKDQRLLSTTVLIYHRQKIFSEHPLIYNLSDTLLNIFVSIEMTGQSVAFEQKFNYRRPMYLILDYMWTLSIHKQRLKELAEIAEENIEAVHPPIFLSFINLLINDAIFLLDEALSCMTQLRELQQERETTQLSNIPIQQRQQNEGNFQHVGLLARFHNMMSNDTVHALEMITREIKSIFIHGTIVDRIAAMLNYFLLHLVGPKKKNLKVKDLSAYEFKPQDLVVNICKIYLNLGNSDEFCLAVSRDGRSYSPYLFTQASQVLTKIRYEGSFIVSLEELANKIQLLAVQQERDDEALADAPEEFLDPIMNTIMKDPVILPSSKVTVDRSTIARHLLSDQTDPFNRSPLTMDMIQSNTELKQHIDVWRKERRQATLNT